MSKKTIEKQIENQIKKYLESIGAYFIKVHGSMFQRAGIPDILCCINGKFVGIEVKRVGGIVSPLQTANIMKIQKAGGVAFVAYSVENVRHALRVSGVLPSKLKS
jgi:Holliday junction resolvase